MPTAIRTLREATLRIPDSAPETTTAGRPAAFLDRDGTVVAERDYLSDPDDVILIPGAAAAIARLKGAGFATVIVTNQSGIARGYYTEAEYRAVERRLDQVLAEAGAEVDRTLHCPHHPDCTGPCDCRKPGTLLHRRAAAALGLDLDRSWCVGDKVADVLPARELGGRGILVRTGYGRDEEGRLPPGFDVEDTLREAVERILGGGSADPAGERNSRERPR